MTDTYTGTRCCGATSVHWVGCRQKLDVNDPRSFIALVDPEEDDAPTCDQCGLTVPLQEFPDGEGGMFNLCDQCTAGVH